MRLFATDLCGLLVLLIGTWGFDVRAGEGPADAPPQTGAITAPLDVDDEVEQLRRTGDLTAAATLLRQAVEDSARSLGREHAETAAMLVRLGSVERELADYSAARLHLETSLETRRTMLGPNHMDVAASLDELGLLYIETGDLELARQALIESLSIRSQLLGARHPSIAGSLNRLGQYYKAAGDGSQAFRYFHQALQLQDELLGEDDPARIPTLMHHIDQYADIDAYHRIQPLAERLLRICRAFHGDAPHPETAAALSHLGKALYMQGEFARARQTLEEVVELRRPWGGGIGALIVQDLEMLACVQTTLAEYDNAAETMDRARRAIFSYATRTLPVRPEREQEAFLRERNAVGLRLATNLALTAPDSGDLVNRSATWVLHTKGMMHACRARQSQAARAVGDHSTPEAKETLRQLVEKRQRLANLSQVPSGPEKFAEWQRELRDLGQQEQDLARWLVRHLAHSMEPSWMELDELRQAIPAGTVLLELAYVEHVAFGAKPKRPEFQPPKYVAWIIPAVGEGHVRLVDLGSAFTIDAQVRSARDSIREKRRFTPFELLVRPVPRDVRSDETLVRIPLKTLADTLLAPLWPHLSDAQRLVICPDANLWTVPWAALPVSESEYLIDKCEVSYVISGRELAISRPTNRPSPTAPMVVAGPDYGMLTHEMWKGVRQLDSRMPPDGVPDETRAPDDQSKARYLPGTEAEARAISPKLKEHCGVEPLMLTFKEALEAAVKRAQSPQVLVLSTHGYFIPDRAEPGRRGSFLLDLDFSDPASFNLVIANGIANLGRKHPLDNALLRCGLLLAGCNERKSAREEGLDDGILTGLEIVGLDLRGTELVVLSACDSGLGDLHSGEGVAGLRQAFQLAGADSVVATLWPISDEDTVPLMADFFANLAAGQRKSTALCNAQRAHMERLRKKYQAAHPMFWAGFTCTDQAILAPAGTPAAPN